MPSKTFAERLKSLRRAARLSQVELAKKAGVPQSAISYFERGIREPTWATACKLAAALGVKLDDLWHDLSGQGWHTSTIKKTGQTTTL